MTAPRLNPFVFGGPVDAKTFFGRKEEVSRVFAQICHPARGSVAVAGERRIGKTSLLHYVSAPDVIRQWNLDRATSVFLFQDCGAVAPLSQSRFWQSVLRKLHRDLERRDNLPGLTGQVLELATQREIEIGDIEFLLDDLHDAGVLFVLLLDEFEWLVRTDIEGERDTRQLLAGLRALINHAPRCFSLIVATRRPLVEVCRGVRSMGSPFYNNFASVMLRPFSEREAEDFLDQTLRGTGMVFRSDERSLIRRLAGTHPLLLQAAAACVFDRKASDGGEVVTESDIAERFRDVAEHQFADLWRWSTESEKRAIVEIASGHTAKVRAEARTLASRGLVQPVRKGVKLFSPAFEEWVLNSVQVGSRRPETGPEQAEQFKRPLVFVSYSREDESENRELMTQLRVLERGAGMLEVWSDESIGVGEDWERQIEESIARCRVAVLVVTANFLTSEFIVGKEVPALLRRREGEGLTVIPVLAKDCAWQEVEWLAKMNVRPRNGKPIWGDRGAASENALAELVQEVAALLRSTGPS